MRTRTRRLDIRLSDREDIKLNSLMRESGLNASQLVRSMILNTEIRTRPPDEYMKLLQELSAIGNNVNQLAHKANAIGVIHVEEVAKLREAVSRLWHEVKEM